MMTVEEHDVLCRKYINDENIPIDNIVSAKEKYVAIVTYVLIYMELFTTSAVINYKTVQPRDIELVIREVCSCMGYDYEISGSYVVVSGIGNILLSHHSDQEAIMSFDESITVTI